MAGAEDVGKDGRLVGFALAGEDKVFHPATAEIVGDSVVVSCANVSKPMAVRYGWKNFPVCNLVNKAGLPASPFRTDDWAPPGLK
jgi:sialate O-acetylesterase